MITTAIVASGKGLETRLTAKARRLGEAFAQNRKQAAIGLGDHWRTAPLLWPLFTTER